MNHVEVTRMLKDVTEALALADAICERFRHMFNIKEEPPILAKAV